jgi:hypothetical protein
MPSFIQVQQTLRNTSPYCLPRGLSHFIGNIKPKVWEQEKANTFGVVKIHNPSQILFIKSEPNVKDFYHSVMCIMCYNLFALY